MGIVGLREISRPCHLGDLRPLGLYTGPGVARVASWISISILSDKSDIKFFPRLCRCVRKIFIMWYIIDNNLKHIGKIPSVGYPCDSHGVERRQMVSVDSAWRKPLSHVIPKVWTRRGSPHLRAGGCSVLVVRETIYYFELE